MNTRQLITLAAFALGSTVTIADELAPPVPGSQTTRAAVQAEYQRARAAGELGNVGERYERPEAAVRRAPSRLTRAEVQAEYQRARASGEMAAQEGERYGSVDVTPVPRAESTARRSAERRGAAPNPAYAPVGTGG